jgi:hypothetical protein
MLGDKVLFRIVVIHLAQNRDQWPASVNIRVTLGMEISAVSERQELICVWNLLGFKLSGSARWADAS